MAKYVGYKRPKDTKKTIKHLLVYLGHYKWMFMLVALLVLLSAGANVTGTYLVKPVVNRFIVPGDMEGLLKAVIAMGIMYACGALCTLGYNRIMVKVSQKVIQDIRNDLFAHVQKLPLKYFDAHTHGELMSRFTNDVDTVQEAMNNSFAMIIQSFIMLFGTLIMMMVLSIRLSMIVVVFLIIMFFFIKFNSKHSKKYFNRQQEELGKINGFVQEMMAGQKVEKVFNHEQKNFEKFCEMNESFRKESTNALAFAGMMIPTIVSLSYLNYAISACVGGIFTLKGLMDLGSLSSYLIYVRQSAMPLNQFTQQVNFLLSALSGAERIFDMMDEEPEVDEGSVTLCNAVKNKKEDVILSNINDIGGADNSTDKKKAVHGKKNKLLYRWIFYIAGLVILALGIMLNTKTNLGVSPIISVPYSISNVIGFNFANMTLIVYVVFVIIEMILHTIWQFVDKSANQLGMYLLRDVLQIPVSIIFTRFLNIFSGMIPSVNNNMPVQIMLLIIAVILTGIGAAMSLNMRIIPNPGDGIVQAISDTTKLNKRKGKGVGFCKNCFDITNVTITFIIGLSTGHFLLGLGVGTILAMIGVGRVIAVFNHLFMDKMNKIAFDYVE